MKRGMKKLGALVLGGLLAVLGGNAVSAHMPTMPTENEPAETPVVYFTRDISSQGLVNVYNKLGFKTTGKVGVKISTGEPPHSNYLRPELLKGLVDETHATIVEDNTDYNGARDQTASHWNVIREHGFTKIAPVDILDADGTMTLPVKNGRWLKEDVVGSHFKNYGSYIVVSHFKGHSMAGFGGAMKNVAIGFASRQGKGLIHSHGTTENLDWSNMDQPMFAQDPFLESMAEANEAVMDAMKGHIVFVNVLNRMSVDCDCDGEPAEPELDDIGILASTDPVAIDMASLDMIAGKPGSAELTKRIFMRDAPHILEAGKNLGVGSKAYKLVDIDQDQAGTQTQNQAQTQK